MAGGIATSGRIHRQSFRSIRRKSTPARTSGRVIASCLVCQATHPASSDLNGRRNRNQRENPSPVLPFHSQKEHTGENERKGDRFLLGLPGNPSGQSD